MKPMYTPVMCGLKEDQLKVKCPVCGAVSFEDDFGDFDVCWNCGWQWDAYDVEHPDEGGGVNVVSFNQAKKNVQEGKWADGTYEE